MDKLTSASSAAETVKSTKKTLEDLVFKQNLGDSSSIDMEASKKAIERKQEEVAKLRENADELEVKSSVSGTIASISASAGKSIGGEEQPLATINVTDRGFTVKIDVTNEQAKKVKVGDTAELVNFWGGDAVATLDQITNSQSSGNRTLVFTLTGDIQAGQNITLSIGQKSSNYDALIPLSGLREDSNGKFVYVLQSKNSAMRRTDSKSPGLEMGKPASMTSTFRRRSWRATTSPPPSPASARAISSSRPAISPWRPASRYGLRITDEAARPV